MACLLGTSTQTDAVLSALGNSRGLWVFSEKPIAPHTASLVPCMQTHRHAGIQSRTHTAHSTHKYTFGLLEKHICVLIFPADIHECCLICARKKKTLSLHIIGRVVVAVAATVVAVVVGECFAKALQCVALSDTISLLLRKSAFRRDQCYQSKLICFD